MLGQLLHALAQRHAKQALQRLLPDVAQRDFGLVDHHRRQHLDHIVGVLFVGGHHRFGHRTNRQRRVGSGSLGLWVLQLRKIGLDQRLGVGRLKVTDHHHGHQVGAIPVFVKALHGLELETLECLLGANRQALGVLGTAEYLGEQDLVHAVLGALAQAQFFQHDAALSVDIGVRQTDAASPIGQHEKALFHGLALVGRQRQDVDGLVEAGVGIQIGAKLQSNRLQVRDQLVLLEVRRAIEGHVLDKVRQAALVIVFQHRARLDHQAQLQTLLGARVFLYVVGQAVGQLTHLDLRPKRYWVTQIERRLRHRASRRKQQAPGQFGKVISSHLHP